MKNTPGLQGERTLASYVTFLEAPTDSFEELVAQKTNDSYTGGHSRLGLSRYKWICSLTVRLNRVGYFTQASALEQEDMREKSSAVTQAYQELSSAHSRATHLMMLRGKPMTETLSQELVGMEFLMQVMEIREAVDDIADGRDEALRPLHDENDERIAETCRLLEEALESGDLDAALQQTARLQYWNRVEETIREKIESYE